jgi:hypothetical protein
MPQKQWEFPLNQRARMLVAFRARSGRVFSFSVVLVVEMEGKEVCITRYDTAHGVPHRDVLGQQAGLIEKEWLFHLTMNEALNYAICDIRDNHEAYTHHFIRR